MKQYILPKILLISLLALLFSACESWLNKVEFKELPDYHWPAYEEGDTLLYKSILTQDVDTFVVTDFVFDTVFFASYYLENTIAIFAQIEEGAEDVSSILIGNEPEGLFFMWDSARIKFLNTDEVLDTTIQGFDYDGLFVASKYRQDTITETLHKVYLDWQYGLVKYTYNNLDSYELFYRPE